MKELIKEIVENRPADDIEAAAYYDSAMQRICDAIEKRTDKNERILSHYAHAREKHPYFCDRLKLHWEASDDEKIIEKMIDFNLDSARSRIAHEIKNGVLCWDDLLECEKWEIFDALKHGDTAHAVEECYDAIAVLLRAIDVIEGRQPLGKPKEKGKLYECRKMAETFSR